MSNSSHGLIFYAFRLERPTTIVNTTLHNAMHNACTRKTTQFQKIMYTLKTFLKMYTSKISRLMIHLR